MKEEDFTKRAVPSADVPKGALTDTAETRGSLHGALLRHYLDANNILMAGTCCIHATAAFSRQC